MSELENLKLRKEINRDNAFLWCEIMYLKGKVEWLESKLTEKHVVINEEEPKGVV